MYRKIWMDWGGGRGGHEWLNDAEYAAHLREGGLDDDEIADAIDKDRDLINDGYARYLNKELRLNDSDVEFILPDYVNKYYDENRFAEEGMHGFLEHAESVMKKIVDRGLSPVEDSFREFVGKPSSDLDDVYKKYEHLYKL